MATLAVFTRESWHQNKFFRMAVSRFRDHTKLSREQYCKRRSSRFPCPSHASRGYDTGQMSLLTNLYSCPCSLIHHRRCLRLGRTCAGYPSIDAIFRVSKASYSSQKHRTYPSVDVVPELVHARVVRPEDMSVSVSSMHLSPCLGPWVAYISKANAEANTTPSICQFLRKRALLYCQSSRSDERKAPSMQRTCRLAPVVH